MNQKEDIINLVIEDTIRSCKEDVKNGVAPRDGQRIDQDTDFMIQVSIHRLSLLTPPIKVSKEVIENRFSRIYEIHKND